MTDAPPRAFRLGLINPNTDTAHTAAMLEVVAGVLPAGGAVDAVAVARGPRSIESRADAAVAAAEVARAVHDDPGHDAYLIACFGDPGLDAARELTGAPVVGIGAAAFAAVAMVARRFAVITTLARGIAELEEAVEAAGLRRRCAGVLALGIPVAAQGAAYPDTTERIIELGRRACEELGADALVLACGGMSGVTERVAQAVGVPATNGVAVGALTAHALWRAGLRTSAGGAYAPPEPIPYDGMPSFTRS